MSDLSQLRSRLILTVDPGVSVAYATRAQPAVAGLLGAHLQGRHNPIPRAEREEEDEAEAAVCGGEGAPGEGELFIEEGWNWMGWDGIGWDDGEAPLVLLYCLWLCGS